MLGRPAPSFPGRAVPSEGSRVLVREGGGSGFGFMPTEDKELLAATQQLCLRSGVASHIKTLFGSVRRHPSTPLHAGAGRAPLFSDPRSVDRTVTRWPSVRTARTRRLP